MQWCLPWWHAQLEAWAKDTRRVTSCPVILSPDPRFPTPGFVPCNPEALRQSAEKRLREWEIWPKDVPLPLDTYSAARLIRAEWGSGPVEAKVVFVECAMNRARLRKQSVTDLLLTNKFNYKNYGRQHAVTGFESQKRWASTARDPTVGDVLIAHFVLQGKTDNFARGGAGFLDPSGMGSRLFTVLQDWMKNSVWVGHLPGIPTNKLFVLRRNGKPTAADQAMNRQGLLALQLGQKPAQPTEVCSRAGRALRMAAVLGISALLAGGITYGIVQWGGKRYVNWPFD